MQKIKLYGLRVSYYTGKMEAYFRYKGIDHEFITLNRERYKMLGEKTEGNLSDQESKMLSEALHALRMMYVNVKT